MCATIPKPARLTDKPKIKQLNLSHTKKNTQNIHSILKSYRRQLKSAKSLMMEGRYPKAAVLKKFLRSAKLSQLGLADSKRRGYDAGKNEKIKALGWSLVR